MNCQFIFHSLALDSGLKFGNRDCWFYHYLEFRRYITTMIAAMTSLCVVNETSLTLQVYCNMGSNPCVNLVFINCVQEICTVLLKTAYFEMLTMVGQ